MSQRRAINPEKRAILLKNRAIQKIPGVSALLFDKSSTNKWKFGAISLQINTLSLKKNLRPEQTPSRNDSSRPLSDPFSAKRLLFLHLYLNSRVTSKKNGAHHHRDRHRFFEKWNILVKHEIRPHVSVISRSQTHF